MATITALPSGFIITPNIDNNGKAWGWGYNNKGQVGNNTIVSQLTPVAICGNHTFKKVTIGMYHSIGIDNHGQLWGWGLNDNGQLGNNTTTLSILTPVAVCGNHTFCQIPSSVGTGVSMAIDKNGKAWGWGYNTNGQLGTNNLTAYSTPVAVCGNHTFCKIENTNTITAAVDYKGMGWSWGIGTNGSLGNNNTIGYSTPVAVCGNHTFNFIRVLGGTNMFALAKNGQAWCWGNGTKGKLGNNVTSGNASIPVAVCGAHTFCKIATDGNTMGYAIDKNGKAWTWGMGVLGQLGNNTAETCYSTPVAVCGNHTFCDIFIRISQAMAGMIDRYGIQWAWGSGFAGNLGNNTTTNYSTPIAVCGGHIYAQSPNPYPILPGTYNYTPFINKFGQTYLWGYGNVGQNGDNSVVCRSSPVAVCGNHNFTIVCKDYNNGCGIDTNGKAWAWGENGKGQTGNNSTVCYSTPVAVCGNHTFCFISTGNNAVLALDNHGKAWGWGYNLQAALGTNNITCYSTPVAVYGNHTFCQINTQTNLTLAIDYKGKAWAWSGNFSVSSGIIGNNTAGVSYSTPVAVCGNHTFCKVYVGQNYACSGIDKNGKAWSWGSAQSGALGNNNDTVSYSTPVAVYGVHTFCDIVSGDRFSVAIDKNGKAWSWGDGGVGKLGNNNNVVCYSTPIAVYGYHTFCKIFQNIHPGGSVTSYSGPHLIDNWGVGWSWGLAWYGGLGNNTGNANFSTPVAIWARNFLQFKPSQNYTYTPYIDPSGMTWGWGYNQWGDPGINLQYLAGDNQSRSTPVAVCGNHTFCQVVWGYDYHMGIDNHGKAWAWGHGAWGQLGNNAATVCILTPVAVCGSHTFCQLAAAHTPNPDYVHSLGIDNHGLVWAWGSNSYGQIGNNAAPTTCTPVQICGNHTFCTIKAGILNSIGIDNHGKAWSWGKNTYGVLGNNTLNTSYSTPVAVYGNHTFCKIDTDYTTIAIDNHGIPWIWGCDDSGALGRNTIYQCRSTPVMMCGNHTFCQVAAANHILAGVDNKGQTWVWGYNSNGDLGNYDINPKSTPVALWGDHKFIYINFRRAQYEYRLGHSIDEFGRMWSWGTNYYGFIGNNSVISQSTPVALYGNYQFLKNAGGGPYIVPIVNILVRHKIGGGLYFFKTG